MDSRKKDEFPVVFFLRGALLAVLLLCIKEITTTPKQTNLEVVVAATIISLTLTFWKHFK